MSGGGVRTVALPPGGEFLHACAAHLLAARADARELATTTLILPNFLLAPQFRAALLKARGGPTVTPRMQTLPGAIEPWLAAQPHLADSRRLFALYSALKARRWLEEGSLWEVCGELVALFDELTLHGVGLPDSLEDFQARLAHACSAHADEPLRFEARLVHALWKADGEGLPSRSAARLLAARAWADSLSAPLFAIAEGPPGAFEARVYQACAQRVAVTVFVPDRGLARDPVSRVVAAAWPVAAEEVARPLIARAEALTREGGGLSGRVSLMPARSLEEEARGVARMVRGWLAAGKRRIALVAADRVAARRTRALLERDGVLVEDETGWKLSTTRAAALVDAWLAVLASDAYHRDVIDLLKSPFVGAGLAVRGLDKDAEIAAIAALYGRHNVVSGLDPLVRLCDGGPGAAAVDLLLAAREAFPRGGAVSPVVWLRRLGDALAALGATPLLAADEAGKVLLGWIDARCGELADEGVRIGFFEWREWLDRELEAQMFRDGSVDSPVVMTHLAAARLRAFEASVVIGADSDNLLADDRRPVFAHEGVRAELGLPGSAAARARFHDDLAGLITLSEEACFSWQHLRGGEVVLPCAAVDILSVVHARAYGDGLRREPQPSGGASAVFRGQGMPAPVLHAAQVPQRLTASGLASLIACPYQYFVRHVLGLGEREEVSEALEKSDYGQLIHSVLQAFHGRFPVLADIPDVELLAALEQESGRVFGPALERNFLEHAWVLRWQARLPDYLRWQREREAEGWRFGAAEVQAQRDFSLADGSTLHLQGRLDRVDQDADGRVAVLDYKSRRLKSLQDQAGDPDDVQLAVYTLLKGAQVAEAAYVALDDEAVASAALADPQPTALRQGERIVALFNALRSGAPLPAHGVACTWCEARGLCRKDFQT